MISDLYVKYPPHSKERQEFKSRITDKMDDVDALIGALIEAIEEEEEEYEEEAN